MQKQERQRKILEIIAEMQVARQDHLTAILESRGFPVNQSSVSRDLVELGVVKVGGYYTRPQRSRAKLTVGVISLEIAGENLIVAKTEVGLASACAVRIDASKIHEIVGTVAGDDTIFIAVRGHKEQKVVLRKVWKLFETTLEEPKGLNDLENEGDEAGENPQV